MPTDAAVEFESDDADRTVRLTYQPDDVNPGFGAFGVEIRADGLACNETVATISGDGLDRFLTQLAEDWAGWKGSRRYGLRSNRE